MPSVALNKNWSCQNGHLNYFVWFEFEALICNQVFGLHWPFDCWDLKADTPNHGSHVKSFPFVNREQIISFKMFQTYLDQKCWQENPCKYLLQKAKKFFTWNIGLFNLAKVFAYYYCGVVLSEFKVTMPSKVSIHLSEKNGLVSLWRGRLVGGSWKRTDDSKSTIRLTFKEQITLGKRKFGKWHLWIESAHI